MMHEPVYKLPMLCEHCGTGFETVRPYKETLSVSGNPGEYANRFSTIVLYEDAPTKAKYRDSCPHCGRKQPTHTMHYWTKDAVKKDHRYHAADLIWFCEYCGSRCGINEVCNRCRNHGHRYQNPKQTLEERGAVCEVCDTLCYPSNIEKHHTSYEPEETIVVCGSCHGKIHHRDGFHDDLEPDMSRNEWLRKRGHSV